MKLKNEEKKRSKDHLKQIARSRKYRARTAQRVVKYGAQSFTRNSWLSVAAIAIMAITLLVMAATWVVTNAMGEAIDMVRQQVDMSVYIKQEAEQKDIDEIIGRIGQLGSVTAVKYVSPEEARHQAIAKLEAESEISEEELAAMYEAPNKLPWTLNVKIVDLNDPSELEYFVYNDGSTKDLLDAKPPSFSSSHRETIDNIAVVMRGIEIGGLVAAAVFAVIAILVVFNTIRMAIFNRKEEIYMMKLIGARKGFVRGPFVVEAIIYGVVAGGIATGVTVGGVLLLDGKFGGALVPTVDFVRQWWWVVLAVLMGVGVLIGTVSAMLATKKYLKLK